MPIVEFQLTDEEVSKLELLARDTLMMISKIVNDHLSEFKMDELDKYKAFRLFNYMMVTRYIAMLLEIFNVTDNEFAKVMNQLFSDL